MNRCLIFSAQKALGDTQKRGTTRGCSSVGRAPALQAGGQGFESLHLHHTEISTQAHSSGGQSACLISTRSVVRVHLGLPLFLKRKGRVETVSCTLKTEQKKKTNREDRKELIKISLSEIEMGNYNSSEHNNRFAKLTKRTRISSSKEEHKENALALGAEEGRDKLR